MSDRLKRTLEHCREIEKAYQGIEGGQWFAGEVGKDEYGFLKVEGYLFPTKTEAQFEIMGRLKRSQVYRSFVLGKFTGKTVFTNRQRWRGVPLEVSRFYPREDKKGSGR